MDIFVRTMDECGFRQPAQVALNDLYHQDHRYYHDLSHIADLLRKIEKIPTSMLDCDPIHLKQVAWWHDAIYEVEPGEDERRSALWMQSYMDLADDDYRLAAVRETAGHTAPSSPLSALFMDLDLSRIGNQVYDDFLLDGEKIRAEYRMYDDLTWLTGRRDFLKALAKRDQIFTTDYGIIWEAQARRNIESAVMFYDRRLDEVRNMIPDEVA